MMPDSGTGRAQLGEPACTEEMSLTNNGGSLRVTIPSVAVKLLDFEVGQTRHVEVYEDGVWVPKEVPGDE